VKIKLSIREHTDLLDAMKLDKKVSAGEIKFVLARQIGKVEFGQKVPANVLHEVLTTPAKNSEVLLGNKGTVKRGKRRVSNTSSILSKIRNQTPNLN